MKAESETNSRNRLDKYLWTVRLFKTRKLAAEACEKGRVRIAGAEAKAGRNIKPAETIIIHRGPWYQHVKVVQLTHHRLSASLVKDFIEDITPADELEKLRQHQAAMAAWNIKKGDGRPTKKDRRDMDEFLDEWL